MNTTFFSTTRYIENGKSINSYYNFNLATHTGDDVNSVKQNRQILIKKYQLPSMPKWLDQDHSSICLDDNNSDNYGDAIITKIPNKTLAVLTADCLPIFAYDANNTVVGIAHCGWKGLLSGIIESFINKFNENGIDSQSIIVYFGAALSQKNFQISTEFYNRFINHNKEFTECFQPFNNKYKFNIYKAATISLTKKKININNIHTCNDCTFENTNLFSYRRDGDRSGRQVHVIYLKP